MGLLEIKEFVDEFIELSAAQFAQCEGRWLKKVEGRWIDRDDSELKGKHGVYFFTTLNQEILYIGKAHKASFTQRVWAHVNTPSLERRTSPDRMGITIYPSHQWINDNKIDAAWKSAITSGDFDVWAIEIKPYYLASLMEIACLTYYWDCKEVLPPLNIKFG